MVHLRVNGRSAVLSALTVLVGLVASGCAGSPGSPPVGVEPRGPSVTIGAPALDAYAPPVYFEPLAGGFVSGAGPLRLILGEDSVSVALPGTDNSSVELSFPGANLAPALEALDPLPGVTNYLTGERSDWRTGVPHFGEVRYSGIYPGVDLVFYGNHGEIEYDFVVAPGADPAVIRVAADGTAAPRLDAHGNLVLPTADGELVQRAPVVYQDARGVRQPVAGRYHLLDDGSVGFELGPYDPALSLVIDPVLTYSTYLGGTADDWTHDIAVDSAGNAYIAGGTSSADFPGGIPAKRSDAVVTKLSPSGTLLYTTVFGGTGEDGAAGVAVDGAGNAYVTGATDSNDFPVQNPLQPTRAGGDDAFVTKLGPTGAIVYSTYLGGSDFESSEGGIAVDSAGQAYVTGYTFSVDFPVVRAFQGHFAGLWGDVFLTKLTPTGSSVVYSTYLGGSSADRSYDVAVTATGNATVTGDTQSADFPTTVGMQRSLRGWSDAFVTGFTPDGVLRYSTYFGGSDGDFGQAIATDEAANAYVTGVTGSSDFPLANPIQGTYGGGYDAFLFKLTSAGHLVYSTFLGGISYDIGQGVAVDGSGHAYVSGVTTSADFPLADPVRPVKTAPSEAFVTKVTPAGNALVYSTYLGPSREGDEHTSTAVAADAAGNATVAGTTGSDGFPVVNAIQPTRRGGLDWFALRLTGGASAATFVTPTSGETGSAMTVSGTGAVPGEPYVVKMSTSAANCGRGIVVGGSVVAAGDGTLGPVSRVIPLTMTSGTRYVCFVSTDDPSVVIPATPITVF